MRRHRSFVHLLPAAAAVGSLLTTCPAPVAHAYESWCDLVETHAPRIALASEPLRTKPDQIDVDRVNLLYNRVIPQLNTVAFATFWYPDIWGSPDIRSDTQALLTAMDNLQDLANDGEHAAAAVQDVDNAIAVLHAQCDGKRGLPPRDAL